MYRPVKQEELWIVEQPNQGDVYHAQHVDDAIDYAKLYGGKVVCMTVIVVTMQKTHDYPRPGKHDSAR